MNGAVLPDGSQAAPPFPAMGDSNSVQWNRTFGKERVSDCESRGAGAPYTGPHTQGARTKR